MQEGTTAAGDLDSDRRDLVLEEDGGRISWNSLDVVEIVRELVRVLRSPVRAAITVLAPQAFHPEE